MIELLNAIPGLLAILLLGAVLCLPLYDWSIRNFLRSSIVLKIISWIPLYLFFVLTVVAPPYSAITAGLVIAFLAWKEWSGKKHRQRAAPYFVYFLVGCVSWPVSLLIADSPVIWVSICLVSVMSDVTAYFIGNYVGGHKLPEWLNKQKSYEGLLGQIIGGVVGVVMVNIIYSVDFSLLLGFIIGVASMIGDLLNSNAKRQLAIKDWAQTIPGHGGVMDRFSSLNMVLIIVCCASVLKIG